jgi:hypothetical protein
VKAADMPRRFRSQGTDKFGNVPQFIITVI